MVSKTHHPHNFVFTIFRNRSSMHQENGGEYATTLLRMGGPSEAINFSELPVAEFAFPGPLRDRSVDAVVSGHKTVTTGLVLAYQIEHEPLPEPEQRIFLSTRATNQLPSLRSPAFGSLR